jgi:serine kinase of HPr protein (carbohydrate metabolism regulator)
MTVAEAAQALGLEVLTGHSNLSREITGGCVSDLLSYVMGTAVAGNLWITIQVHPNIVGVAELLDLSAVVVAHGQVPEEATVSKAREQGIPLLTSAETAFGLAGRLYALTGSAP